ncbi:unknown [Ruminococcus sp. CAG:579]|nr:unknown [Ruminococcus sp. CAG:579]
MNVSVYARKYLLLLLRKLALVHYDAHGVDTRRHMLERYSVFLELLKHLSAEAQLAVHHIFFDVYYREALFARDACDGVKRLLAGALYYESAWVAGLVCVLDVYRYARFANGENSVLVQYGSAHVSQLAKLFVSDGADRLGVFYYSGVADEEARNVSPVFVKVSVSASRYDRAGNVRTAARESLYSVVRHRAIEAWNYRALDGREPFAYCFQRAGRIESAVLFEEYHLSGVYEGVAEVCRQHLAVEELSARSSVISARSADKASLYGLELFLEREVYVQLFDNAVVSFFYSVKFFLKVLALYSQLVAAVEHIGDLGVLLKALAGGGGNYISS